MKYITYILRDHIKILTLHEMLKIILSIIISKWKLQEDLEIQ